MPEDFWARLAKVNYLDYRKVMALKSGHRSPQMIAAINALESKLAVRGQIQSNVPSTDIVEVARALKVAQTEENRRMANEKLQSFLETKALSLKEELEMLGCYILSVGPPGAKWIPGPLKKIEKAMGKTTEDYDFAWGLNKDLVRGTLACQNNEDLAVIAALLMRICVAKYGMFLIKQDNQKSVRDGGEVKSGYSGWNFVVQFKNHTAFGAEMQANTFAMMYGKMSKQDFCENLKHSEGDYTALQNKLKFPGGLGHALYDIQDTARSKATDEEGNLARELCLDYNDACRGQFRQTTLAALNTRLQEFGMNLTSSNAKDLWRHCVDGCGWSVFQILQPV